MNALPKLLAGLALASLAFATGCAAETSEDVEATDEALTARRFTLSASTVEAMDGSLEGVTPAVRTADPGHTPDFYLSSSSALGPNGPLGAWGPLGALGPIGN